jgi:integrase/recombinase XerD
MSVLDPDPKTLATIIGDPGFDEAQMAAAALSPGTTGTLDAYRYNLRTFFPWAADVGLTVMEAKRPHIELYRTAMEQNGLAPSTIDRRLSTVSGFYRFAHIDCRVNATPAGTSGGRRSTLRRGEDWIAESSELSGSQLSASISATPR